MRVPARLKPGSRVTFSRLLNGQMMHREGTVAYDDASDRVGIKADDHHGITVAYYSPRGHLIANGYSNDAPADLARNGKTKAQLDADIARALADYERKMKDHERITITWYATPNENKARGGWLPQYTMAFNGVMQVNSYDGKVKIHGEHVGRGYDKDEAEQHAEAMAHKEAERYTGDVIVTVEPAKQATATKAKGRSTLAKGAR